MESTSDDRSRKRFVRRALPDGIALTERDLRLLCELVEHRFLTARHFQALYGARIFRRLHVLFDHGYVDRPRAQRAWRQREGGGSKPIVYALANRGAKALADAGLLAQPMRDWSERNRNLSHLALTIPHELLIADLRIAFRAACARNGLHMLAVDALAQQKNGRALEVPGREKPLYPDWIFAIVPQGEKPSLFFVEVDRGTEQNVRHGSPVLQSLKRKYDGYLGYARAKRHHEQFGVDNFRVLTITTGGETKVANIAQTALEVCGRAGFGRFLTTSFAALEDADPLAVAWRNGAGEKVWLLG